MTTQETIQRLEDRLRVEQEEYEKAGLPNYNRLNKRRLFSSLRKQTQISRRIHALKAAIELLTEPLRVVDIHEAVLMSISDRNGRKEALLRKAESIYLNERKEALKEVFETSLPILKKEILTYL